MVGSGSVHHLAAPACCNVVGDDKVAAPRYAGEYRAVVGTATRASAPRCRIPRWRHRQGAVLLAALLVAAPAAVEVLTCLIARAPSELLSSRAAAAPAVLSDR